MMLGRSFYFADPLIIIIDPYYSMLYGNSMMYSPVDYWVYGGFGYNSICVIRPSYGYSSFYEKLFDSTEFLNLYYDYLNKYSKKYNKILIVGAINKFDGHVFTFDFKNKNTPCLKCFYQSEPSDEILNCEAEGVMGPIAGMIGNIQANEVLKKILKIGKDLNKRVLIINLLTLNFRKVSFNKKKKCQCKNY
mgnify:CR=1 FL=1